MGLQNATCYEELNIPRVGGGDPSPEAAMEMVYRSIAQNIREEQEKQNMSLARLAKLSGVDAGHLSRIFAHRSHIGLEVLLKVADALCVNPKELLPYAERNDVQTDGKRYDDMTKGLSLEDKNFLMGLCTDFCRYARSKQEGG